MDIVKLNEALRSVFGIPPQAIKSRQLQALAWGRQGPFWYRGYFAAHARHFGPAPTVDEMDTILRNLGAKTIVVGHTKVERIAPLFGERRVLPIDIPWTHPARVRGIVIRGKRIDVIDAQGTRRRLE